MEIKMDEKKQEMMSAKEGIKSVFDSIKTPVFWLAVGYIACKVLDRKKL